MSAVLWQIPISHYSEKARWALELKGVEHERRSPTPPAHIPIALWLTRGAQPTLPVLVIDGVTIGGSSAIIAALEQRFPEPSLYPADPAERERALSIEGFFDTELGPYARTLVFHDLRRDPDGFADLSKALLPGPLRGSGIARSLAGRVGRVYTQLRFRVAGDDAAAEARAKIVAALDRLEAELEAGDGIHMAGGRFSVADLSAAALLAPIVQPPLGPEVPVTPPPAFEQFRATISGRRGFRWVEETFARHRGDPRRP